MKITQDDVRKDIAAIDQKYRDATGCTEFGVFRYEGEGKLVLKVQSGSATEMVIAATALAAIDEEAAVLVIPIGGTGIITALGHPYAVTSAWAYKSGAAPGTLSAILGGALAASKAICDIRNAPLTEH